MSEATPTMIGSVDGHVYKFNITMTCGGCSGAVDRVLKKLDGTAARSQSPWLHMDATTSISGTSSESTTAPSSVLDWLEVCDRSCG